jgi:hypothetical protein
MLPLRGSSREAGEGLRAAASTDINPLRPAAPPSGEDLSQKLVRTPSDIT